MTVKFNETAKEDAIVLLLKEGIAKGRHPEFQIVSNSMFPILQFGDRIFVKEVTTNNLVCGDIIIYKLNNHLIAHRFLFRKSATTFITQGDNSTSIDKPITNDSLIGKIVLIDKKDVQINLETKRWQVTNSFLGKALSLIAQNSDKNIFVKLLIYLWSEILLFLVLIINPEYRKISKPKKRSLIIEKELLKICSKKELSNTDIEFVKKVADKEINWGMFSWLAEYNSVAPIVYMNLSKINSDLIPEEALERLKFTYTESFLKTAPVYDDLSKLLKELNSKQIKVIVLKGCSLAEQLYGDFSLRPMKDIDILVKKQYWPKIKEVLEKLNFKSEKDLLELENLLGASSDWHHYYKNQRETKIEFKFNLFILDFPDFDSSNYWQEAISITVNNVATLSLSIEDQIIYLSSRMINVGFRNLLWFCDLRELINTYREKINWEKIIAKAKQKKVTVALYNSLLILNKELNAEIPNNVLSTLKPSFIKEKVFDIFYSLKYPLFFLPENLFVPNPIISLCLIFGKFSLRIKDIIKLLRYTKKILLPSSEYIIYRYNLPKKKGIIFYWYIFRLKEFIIRLLILAKIFNRRPKPLVS